MLDLTVYDEIYEATEVEEQKTDFKPIPDGNYNVMIMEAELEETKESRKPMIVLQMKVMVGNHTNRVLFKNSVINSAKSLKYIKKDFAVCGLKLDKFSDIENRVSELIGLKLEIYVKNKGENQNVYINKCIDDMSIDESNSITSGYSNPF